MRQILIALVLVSLSLVVLEVVRAVAGPRERPTANPRELGHVGWLRGFDAALETARRDNKPLLVLFDEVPGCATCTGYGDNVLRHPLVVEAAETLFVPVAVYNNAPGDDERTLKSFDEPAWNNPVVRIVDSQRKDIVPRLDGDYTVGGLVRTMVTALEKSDRSVPAYLRLLAEESTARSGKLERAAFGMHCFWEGEGKLGDIPGVVATQPGFLGGVEVVDVAFDARRIDFADLVAKATKMQCATRVFCRTDAQQKAASRGEVSATRSDEPIRPDREPKYYLAQTPLRHVPMTELQACRVNAAVGRQRDPKPFLSPRQIGLLDAVTKRPDVGWPNAIATRDLVKAWSDATDIARRSH